MIGDTMRRSPIATIVVVLLAFQVACGATARERTIRTALVSTNTARDAFVIFDRTHQTSIADTATSLEDGKTKLAAWRDRRDKVSAMFIAVYRAIGVAAALDDDPKSLENLSRAAKLLVDELSDIKKGTP